MSGIIPTTNETKRFLVLNAIKNLHAEGQPFNKKDVMARCGHCSSSISSITAQYINEVSNNLLETIVTNDSEYESWRKEFLTLRAFLMNTTKRNELFFKWVTIHIDHIYRSGKLPILTNVRAISGSHTFLIRKALDTWYRNKNLKQPREQILPYGSARPRVIEIFNQLYKEKKIITLGTIAEQIQCSDQLVALYLKDTINPIVDHLLTQEVDDNLTYEEWCRNFRSLRALLNNHKFRIELFRKWVWVHIDFIYRSGRQPNYTEVQKLSGSGDKLIRKTLDYWSEKLNIPLTHKKKWEDISLEEVLNKVDDKLKFIPLTFLESESFGKSFNNSELRLLVNIRNDTLRNIAFFSLAISDSNRVNDKSYFSRLDKYLYEMGISEFKDFDPHNFYKNMFLGEIFPNFSENYKIYFFEAYFRLIKKQKIFFKKLTSEQKEIFDEFKIIEVDDLFWRESNVRKVNEDNRKSERKSNVSGVHEKFYHLRELTERRYHQVNRLYLAYLEAVKAAKNGKELPIKIQLTEEIMTEEFAIKVVNFNLLLWNGVALKKYHQQVEKTDFYKNVTDNHPSNDIDKYYLTYDNSYTEDKNFYWFSRLLSAGYLSNDIGLKSIEVSRTIFNNLPRKFLGHSISNWIKVLRDKTDLEFIPIDLCMTCCLIGNSSIQIITKTGARVNELLQIRLDSKHLLKVKLPNNTETIVFYAVPKGRISVEPYYIDDKCMKSLHAWWKYSSENNSKFEEINPIVPLRQKVGKANYLFQINNSHLQSKHINASISFILFDVYFKNKRGGKVNLTTHLLRHSFATEMRSLNTPIDVLALLMKQHDTSVTEYYSAPTPTMLFDIQRKIFENRVDLGRTFRRSNEELNKQLKDAMDTIGAVTPVIGGRCTVANACPAAFACIGCFGNVPDPQKREQILEYKDHYIKMLEGAKTNNLPHEERKATKLISNCDDMLHEMDCIEHTENIEVSPIKIKLMHLDGSEI